MHRRLVFFLTALVSLACQKNTPLTPQWMDVKEGATQKKLGEPRHPYLALHSDLLGSGTLAADTPAGRTLLARMASPTEEPGPIAAQPVNSLVLGFPSGLLGEEQLFGAVITAVTDLTSEKLGSLKLTDLPPIHVRPVLRQSAEGGFFLDLMGCAAQCTELSPPASMLKIPVLGVDTQGSTILLDLASLGRDLNLIDAMDPGGEYTELETVSATVTRMEYSVSTLVFDVDVAMVPIDPVTQGTEETTFTIRWYLRLSSGFHTAFTPRAPTTGVGFFQTDRRKDPLIGRLPLSSPDAGKAPIKYYVKNVPQRYRAGFQKAFDDWNRVFRAEMGGDLIEYEFVDTADPRAALLVPGDPRYFIVEWDLVNAASYGGLGPAMMNQNTGEIFSANVLVQGPKIEELYTEWFKVGTQARELRNAGEFARAAALEHAFVKARKDARQRPTRFQLNLGEHTWRVASQDPRLKDPVMKREGFEPLPTTLNYDQYMEGYFRELVAHELGHNLGLRHNFHGNLSADPVKSEGKVSSSIMEYLGRGHRHLNRIGKYDEMAVAYGYFGERPAVRDGFCTDEEVADRQKADTNPECSRDDASNDPFGYFEWQLTRALDLLLLEASPDASPWTIADMEGDIREAVDGMVMYATNVRTYRKWKTFFEPSGRPYFLSSVRPYVARSLRDIVCDERIERIIATKATPEAQSATRDLVTALRGEVIRIAGNAYSASDLACR